MSCDVGVRAQRAGALDVAILDPRGDDPIGVLAILYPIDECPEHVELIADLPVRYALILSLSTQADDVNIYQSVATQLEVDIEAVAIEV